MIWLSYRSDWYDFHLCPNLLVVSDSYRFVSLPSYELLGLKYLWDSLGLVRFRHRVSGLLLRAPFRHRCSTDCFWMALFHSWVLIPRLTRLWSLIFTGFLSQLAFSLKFVPWFLSRSCMLFRTKESNSLSFCSFTSTSPLFRPTCTLCSAS